MASLGEAYSAHSGTDGFANPTASVRYKIYDAATFQEAMSEIFDSTPATLDVYGDGSRVLTKASVAVEELEAGELWDGVVTYELVQAKTLAPPAPDASPEFSFNSGGGTQRILRSRETLARFPNSSTDPNVPEAPDFSGAIGVTSDGIQGVDIVAAQEFRWSETHYFTSGEVTWAYLKTVADMRATINSLPFRGFDAGEVLFIDFSARRRGPGDWEITYQFSRLPNVDEVTVGDIDVSSIGSSPVKRGWDYLWVYYQPQTGSATVDGASVEVAVVPTPAAVYIEKVYEDADFDDLNIGTEATL